MLRRPTHSELSETMSHVYLFSHVGLYVFPYLLNYITSLYCKLSENYKHGCRNDQPICKNKGRNECNEQSWNNLRFFKNNLDLVYYYVKMAVNEVEVLACNSLILAGVRAAIAISDDRKSAAAWVRFEPGSSHTAVMHKNHCDILG